MTDMFNQLDEEVTYAEAWMPVVGDKIVGTVTKIDSRTTEFGEYPILTLAVEAGTQEGKDIGTPVELSWHVLGTVAQRELGFENGAWLPERKVKVGSKVGAKYVEDRKGKSGYGYAFWHVLVQNPTMAEQLDQPSLFS